MTASVYYAGNLIEKGRKSKKAILKLTLFLLIGNLLFHKYLLINTAPISLLYLNHSAKLLWPLGLSYISFRLIHYLVEIYRKNILAGSFVDFSLYILFFPTFLAGPVERFPSFQSQTTEKKNFSRLDFNYGLYRIICGLIKKCFIADSLARLISPVLYQPQNYTRAFIILSVYALAVRIYMDFSGYTDIAIGTARLFGYKIMENFNRPFLQKNIALFWRNWHISVYSWIRDYFFFPVFGYRASKIKIYAGIFCTMTVFMLWHRFSLNFLFLGFYYGLGLSAWYIFQKLKRKYFFIQRAAGKHFLAPFSIFVTFSFVSFGFIFFNCTLKESFNLIKHIFT